jgi:hypothetical protein
MDLTDNFIGMDQRRELQTSSFTKPFEGRHSILIVAR